MRKKLTHFFSDHSPSSSSSSSSPSSTSSDHDQTRSPFKEDSYMSSMLSFFFPSNESISKKNEDYIEPIPSLKSIRCGKSKTSNPKEENEEQNSGRSTSSPEVFEDAIDLQTPKKYIPDQNLDSVFISSELYQFFQSCLPNIVKGCRWVLLYRAVR